MAVQIHRRALRFEKGPFDKHGRPHLEYMTLRMQLWPEHAAIQPGQPRKNWNGQMVELTDRILAAANSLDQEHQREWRHWEEVAHSHETWDKAIAMVLAEVEAQASIDTHEQRHAEKETAPVGAAPGNILPRKIWKAPELAASCEKCSYCGLWLRRDSVHRHLASSCPARILSGAPLPRARRQKAERALATMRLRRIQEEAHRRGEAEVAQAGDEDRPLVGCIPDLGPIPCGTKIEACPYCGLHLKKKNISVLVRVCHGNNGYTTLASIYSFNMALLHPRGSVAPPALCPFRLPVLFECTSITARSVCLKIPASSCVDNMWRYS